MNPIIVEISADTLSLSLRRQGNDLPPSVCSQRLQNTSIALLEDAFNKMNPIIVEISADTLSLSAKDTVDVVVFGEKGLDVTKAKKENFVFGITYPDPNVDVNMELAKATKMQVKDVNADGVNTDLWLFGEIDS